MLPQIALAQKKSTGSRRKHTPASASSSAAGNLNVASDLAQRLAKYRRVKMPFQAARLSARERRMVGKLVEAAQSLEDIFWRQNDPEALTLYQSLAASTNLHDQKVRRYLFLNASRFDL